MKTQRTAAAQWQHGRGAGTACLMLFLLLAGMAPAHGAGVFRVDAASTATTPDGQSWETAYATLQGAVAAASVSLGGELWVKAGTYTSTETEVVSLVGGVDLYGGFAGTETDRAQRDWETNPTVIDGQYARRCVMGHSSATLDGFTLANGKAPQGGGMWGGTAVNCAFIGNAAMSITLDDDGYAYGGGMYGGTAVNCAFMRNTAMATSSGYALAQGGGMYDGTATNCTFAGNSVATATHDNESHANGGGMYNGTATNCIFMGNSAMATATANGYTFSQGGGILGGTATNCTFAGNSATAAGSEGTLALGGGAYDATVTNCTFMGNAARAEGFGSPSTYGGGMCFGTAMNCIFWGNTAPRSPDIYNPTSVIYSCVRGGYAGEGNIAEDPKFADAPHDLRLLAGSPCLDTGTADGAPADDIVGNARPQGAGVDMGAYESAALGVPHAPVVGADASGANPPTWTWTPGGGGIGQYRFGFAEGVWEIVDLAVTAYTPPIPLPAGGHTLYVQERDAAGNWSASGTHTLTVTDTAPPTGTVIINGNASTTASSTVALALTWDDGLNGSGVSRMRFSNDGATWSPWEKQASLKSWTLPAGTGYKTVRAQFLDRSGNRSAVCSDYIKVVAP